MNRNKNIVTTRMKIENLKKLDLIVAATGLSRNAIINKMVAEANIQAGAATNG